MSRPELEQLELFAQVDELVRRLAQWADEESPWEPMNRCAALVRRLLTRLETLRIRLEAPLVVATFGGTGTGKSSLVNALVGREITRTGRERPTTTQPVLIAHPEIELDALGLPLDELSIVRCDSAMLRDIILIDCPDPDTSETESPGSNLERLHRFLPHCDVLIYTSTQQKYRSARVADELGQAATGCRLCFVQTHADIDDDIREDWRLQLDSDYDVPDVFFVDSVRALQEQIAGKRPTGDFAKLQDLLGTRLAASARVGIRRANLLDLIDGALKHCKSQFDDGIASLDQLETVLTEQRQQLVDSLTTQLRDELQSSRHLWERRLLSSVTNTWGFSPFSSVLRFYNGLGNLIASSTMLRARTSAQVALIGAVQGTRWLSARQKEREAETQLEQLSSFGLDDAMLRKSQLVVAGYLQEAQLDPGLVEQSSIDNLRHEAVLVEGRFLGDAGRRIDRIIEHLTKQNSGIFVRAIYELLFLTFVGFVLYRVGRNFFFDSFLHDAPLLTVDFYVSAGVFFALWSGVLVMFFTRRLRRGLSREIDSLATELAASRMSQGLFPEVENACRELQHQRERLEMLTATTSKLRAQVAGTTGLGTPVGTRVGSL